MWSPLWDIGLSHFLPQQALLCRLHPATSHRLDQIFDLSSGPSTLCLPIRSRHTDYRSSYYMPCPLPFQLTNNKCIKYYLGCFMPTAVLAVWRILLLQVFVLLALLGHLPDRFVVAWTHTHTLDIDNLTFIHIKKTLSTMTNQF